jgi:type I restriction enzyme S subunit
VKWPEARLRQFCRFRHGGTPSKAREDFWNGNIPWVSPKDMRPNVIRDTEDHITRQAVDEDGALIAPPNSILIVVRSGILVRTIPIALTAVEASFNQDMKSLQIDARVASPEFVFWFLKSRQQQMLTQGVKRGATVHSIQSGFIESLLMPVPAPSEQRRIVEILQQADALRQKRSEADDLADRILTTLFRKLFGDPATNPNGWNSKPLGKSLRLASGGTPSKANPDYWKGAIPWVSPKDMKSVVISDTEDHISKEAVDGSATTLIPQGSAMIVVRSGILAHSVPVAIAAREMAINQDLKALIPDTKEFHPLYLLAWLIASKQLLLGCVKRGATVHSIDSGKFLSLPFIAPPRHTQEAFARQFENILQMEKSRATAGHYIENLFSTMLHRAFTGELTATWREAHFKELLAEMQKQSKALNPPTNGRN